MKIELPKQLTKLAAAVRPYAPIFAVGGYVRNKIMGLDGGTDVDICAPLSPSDLARALENSEFKVMEVNMRLGTVIVRSGDFKAEYTAFRCDSYPSGSGEHTPTDVRFTDDMTEDALRRDFKMNAVYCDLSSGEIVDPLGGVDDINRKIISTADLPQTTLSCDGLRILRMVRFAAQFGFEIESDTLQAATALADRLDAISRERIADEISKMLIADTAYPTLQRKHAPSQAIRTLLSIGALERIFPEIAALDGLKQPSQYHLYDAFGHTMAVLDFCPPHLRYAGLFHDVAKAYCMRNFSNMHAHPEEGERLVKEYLGHGDGGLRLPKHEVARIAALVRWHMYDMMEQTKRGKLRLFIAEHAEIMDDLIALKYADSYGAVGYNPDFKVRMEAVWREMKCDSTPLSVSDLKVGGEDLIALGVEPTKRGALMKSLWRNAVVDDALRTREAQLQYLRRQTEK